MTPATEARLKMVLATLDQYFSSGANMPPVEFEHMVYEVKALHTTLEQEGKLTASSDFFKG